MDDRNSQKSGNSSSGFTQSTANLKPIDDGGARQMVGAILFIAGIGICCPLFAIAALFIFQPSLFTSIANIIPTSIAINTHTPIPNLTATSDAYQTAVVSAQNQWPASVSQQFDDSSDHWYTGTDDNQYSKITYEVKDGKYRWNATAHKGFIQWIRISEKQYTDFYVAADVQESENPPASDSGILFREDGQNNHYYFGINRQRGVYMVLLYYQEKWTTLIGPNSSSFIQSTEPNRLTVIANGPHFSFFINNHFVGEMTDNHIAEGMISLGIEMYQPDSQNIFEFDNIDLRIPPVPATLTPTITMTPTITTTPTFTSTPTLTPTAYAFLEPPKEVAILQENFDSNKQKWNSYNGSNALRVEDGKLYLTSKQTKSIALALCNGCQPYTKAFYFQAEVIPAQKTNIQHGIAFCVTGKASEYYVLEVDSSYKAFALTKKTPTGWKSLITYKISRSVNKYPMANTLGILFDHGKIDLYINDKLVNSYTDTNPISACKKIGIFAGDGPVNIIADNVFAYSIEETLVPTLTPTP